MKILLYDYIIKHDLTFRQVAELTGIPRSTVSDIANGKTSPTMNQMEQLAAGLQILFQIYLSLIISNLI